MNSPSLAEFTRFIRQQLDRAEKTGSPPYLDLANLDGSADLEPLLARDHCCQDPFQELQEIIYDEIARGHLAKVKIAVNELLKHYLKSIRPDTEETCTRRYLEMVEQIFKGCFATAFPYHEEVWVYLNQALKTTGLYLLDKGYRQGSKHILEALFAMGKAAAQKGLATTATQSCLRMLELRAAERNCPENASLAKNFRFNLETY